MLISQVVVTAIEPSKGCNKVKLSPSTHVQQATRRHAACVVVTQSAEDACLVHASAALDAGTQAG